MPKQKPALDAGLMYFFGLCWIKAWWDEEDLISEITIYNYRVK
jgi:hypothetical protein